MLNEGFVQIGGVLVRINSICDIRDWKSVPVHGRSFTAGLTGDLTGILFVGRDCWLPYSISYEDLSNLFSDLISRCRV